MRLICDLHDGLVARFDPFPQRTGKEKNQVKACQRPDRPASMPNLKTLETISLMLHAAKATNRAACRSHCPRLAIESAARSDRLTPSVTLTTFRTAGVLPTLTHRGYRSPRRRIRVR